MSTITVKPTKLAPVFEKGSDVLARNTEAYWQLASRVNGRIDHKLTVGTAIKTSTALQKNIAPQRLLASLVQTLTDGFISGTKKSRHPKSHKFPPNIINL